HGLADVRADHRAAVDERRVRDGELQRADLQRALADREVDRLALGVRRAGVPLEVPAGHREVARRGTGEVDGGSVPSPSLRDQLWISVALRAGSAAQILTPSR